LAGGFFEEPRCGGFFEELERLGVFLVAVTVPKTLPGGYDRTVEGKAEMLTPT